MNGLGPVKFSLCSSSFFDALGSAVALSRRPACRPAATLERAPEIRAETVLCGPQELGKRGLESTWGAVRVLSLLLSCITCHGSAHMWVPEAPCGCRRQPAPHRTPHIESGGWPGDFKMVFENAHRRALVAR